VARKYMIRLEPADLEEPRLSRLSVQTSLSAEAFVERFRSTVGAQPEAAASR
jgi:hypothetical protein